jgi:hypothetical protein
MLMERVVEVLKKAASDYVDCWYSDSTLYVTSYVLTRQQLAP